MKLSLLILGVSLLITYVRSVEGTRKEKLIYVARSLTGKHMRVGTYRTRYSFESLVDSIGHQTGAFA